ncbi:MAG: fatty acid desaturase [Planctomycetes bacterium]|nr:fatty acid desaturase [Planctomycetota bacterium]
MSSSGADPAAGDSIDMGTAALPGRAVLDISVVRSLSHRSDLLGCLRFGTHLLVMTATGFLVHAAMPNWWWLIPAMILHGFTIVTMFAPMHECVHRTAFASRNLNEVVGWLAGLLSFYNFTYYRHYHTWHHRYTQDPGRDPELMTPKPRNMWEYLIEISAVQFWFFRPVTLLGLTLGRTKKYPFLPATARLSVAVSAGLQLAVYVAAISSIAMGYDEAWFYFFFPAILAQPLLRAILIAEHTGCTTDENGLTNTRTTLTNPLIRLLMWNMPYHTEHHLYPSIPFHQLPRAHRELRSHLAHLAPNYVAANRTVIQSLNAPNHVVAGG